MMRVFVHEHFSGGDAAGAAGELIAAGRAMRDAVARDLLLAGDCSVSVAAGRHAPSVPVGSTALHAEFGETATDFVARQSRLHDRTWVIAPETGGVLAQLQRVVDARRWLGCDAASIALATSKHATLARAAEHGVTTPLAFVDKPETRRWVVKPDDGAGALATRVHDTLAAALEDAGARRSRGEAAVLEAWVAGEPLSLSLVCGAGDAELLCVNRQQLAIDALGVLTFVGVQIDALPRDDACLADDARIATLREWARVLVQAVPGLRGYVGIDLVWHVQRGPVLIEINPRVTMACVGLSAALGRNFASAVLAAHQREFADAVA